MCTNDTVPQNVTVKAWVCCIMYSKPFMDCVVLALNYPAFTLLSGYLDSRGSALSTTTYNVWLIKQEEGGDKLLGRGYYDSRLATANDTCADCSCLDSKDVKSLKFVVVFLGRDGYKAATHPCAGILAV